MTIIRVRKDRRYFTASNEPFIDKRLSWETRGLMGYLLTKPDNWQVRIEDLVTQGPAKLHKVRRMLAEARLYGYMNRIRITLPGGTFDWITEVFESPSQNPNPSSSVRKSVTGEKTRVGLSTSGSAAGGSSTSGKPADIVSTDSTITSSSTPPNIYKLYEQNIGPLTPLISDELKDLEANNPVEWVVYAISEAANANARNMKFIVAVVAGCKKRGSHLIPRKAKRTVRNGKAKKGSGLVAKEDVDYEALREQAAAAFAALEGATP
jgi:DnaD/phage-associated family protein